MTEKINPETLFIIKIYTFEYYVKFSFWVSVFYTTYISIDLAHHEIFCAKVGKGGIMCCILLSTGSTHEMYSDKIEIKALRVLVGTAALKRSNREVVS